MTCLFIDRRDAHLSFDGGALVIRAGEARSSLPLGQLERIVVRGAATLEAGLLSALWSRGVGLLLLSGRRGEPTARFHGQPHNDVRRRIAQILAACDQEAAVRIAARVVRAKLDAQVRTLDDLSEARPALRTHARSFAAMAEELRGRIMSAASLDVVRGHEGGAARVYWDAIAGAFAPALNFSGRNRRPPRDPVNAALSLVYTIATAEAGRAAQIVGLDPMVGFLHAPAFGRESLACDLVEPLRPRIDAWIEAILRTRVLRVEHFSTDPDGACLLGKAGRAALYAALGDRLPVWARWLRLAARALARDVDGSPVPGFDSAPETDSPGGVG